MYIRIQWTNFNCPFCGTPWSRRIVTAPRPEKELRTCSNCNREFKTHDIEWAHMTKGQKVGYFLNEWTVAWLLFYAMVALTLHLMFSDRATMLSDRLVEATTILGVAVVMFGPTVLKKWLSMRRSKQRTLATDATAAWVPGSLAG
jgi:hypothetical protein